MSYATVAEARAEGIPVSISDARIQAALNLWQQFIERATRQFFEPRSLTLMMDGNDSDTLFLPVPVISVSNLYVNNDFTVAVAVDKFQVYSNRGEPRDDRYNPKIRLSTLTTIFDPPVFTYRQVFVKGKLNQKIIGSFGFTESDGSTPLMIKRALLKLAIRDLQAQGSSGLWASVGGSSPPGPRVSETTDGHSITFANPLEASNKVGFTGVTGDPEVDKILELYKAPIAMAVPGSVVWFNG